MEKFIETLTDGVDAFETVKLCPETNFTSLEEWDSLALLSCMAAISSEYGIAITSEEISSRKNIKELFDFVESKK